MNMFINGKAARPALRTRWDAALFLHYQVPPEELRVRVPFTLDLHEGRAIVSVVAVGVHPPFVARQCFLNARTYVRPAGIHFLTGWISNPMSGLLASHFAGIPYRTGRFSTAWGAEGGRVSAPEGTFRFRAAIAPEATFVRCAPGSLDEFLLERYAAFTLRGGRRRVVHLAHAPWLQTAARVTVDDPGLLLAAEPWLRHARLIGAHATAPLDDVRMAPPSELTP